MEVIVLKFVLILLVTLFCLIGLGDVIHTVKLFLLKSSKHENKYLVCVLTDNTAEFELRYLSEYIGWSKHCLYNKIICINRIKSSKVLNNCRQIARINNFELIADNEITNIFKPEM